MKTYQGIRELPYVSVEPEVIKEQESEKYIQYSVFYRHLWEYVSSQMVCNEEVYKGVID